ncbi:MAG: helix-turn-helix domain-containing protein [Deltaproteobacteria bacterium]|nr:helix-turn-helix domain-containing protein [Deltaproteobacteria bacterium]
MESVGQYLKRERELRGVSLEEISGFARISVNLLLALESDDFETLPHRIFVKGYILSYCKCIGLDDTEAVLKYETLLKEKEGEKTSEPVSDRFKSSESERFALPHSVMIGTFVFLGVAVIIVYSIFFNSPQESDKFTLKAKSEVEKTTTQVEDAAIFPPLQSELLSSSSEALSLEAVSEGNESRLSQENDVEAKPQIKDNASNSEKKAKIIRKTSKLRILATEKTWIKARLDGGDKVDGGRTVEVLLKAGDRVTWKASKVFFC